MHKRLGQALGGRITTRPSEAHSPGTDTPLMRVVPVQETIEDRADVLPYERARSLVDAASYIAVTECACRVSVNACDKPREVCLVFGPTAQFLVDRGYARQIDKAGGLRRAQDGRGRGPRPHVQ